MKRLAFASVGMLVVAGAWGLTQVPAAPTNLDDVTRIIDAENVERGVELEAVPVVDDLTFLRRIYVDLIGRIPSEAEINDFMGQPSNVRRANVVDALLEDPRFVDTWTVFYADMLRLRSNADGGAATLAYVHRALEERMPHDELSFRLISATGKAGSNPEIGFILGDNADAMALAGVTAQVFMGLRVACAQCHDHPFDKWTREDFYGFAAYFGKTRRIETQFTKTVYTTEVDQTTVLWPPEGAGEDSARKPMKPTFLFDVKDGADGPRNHIARLKKLRSEQAALLAQKEKKPVGAEIDDLLTDAAGKAEQATKGKLGQGLGILDEAKNEARSLNISASFYQQSELRKKLAETITSPHNRYFSRSFVNRVWAQLVGRGLVEPIDDFNDSNPPSHPKTLDFLSDEFVASGFDLRTLVRMVVLSEPYQRGHAFDVDDLAKAELETAFLATPVRRMLSEALYDSVVIAGHLFDVKHVAGKNMKVVWRQDRVEKKKSGANKGSEVQPQNLAAATEAPEMKKPQVAMKKPQAGYNLEQAIALDFDAILRKAQKKGAGEPGAEVESMRVMSPEEIEAMRMAQDNRQRRPGVEYLDRFIKAEIDDNPMFMSSLRMASPAAPEHFLRVFGQTDRTQLGETRDEDPTMRQALMMLNGRLTHEASRVGELEAVYPLLMGRTTDMNKAVRLAYREILTREPSSDELEEGKLIVAESANPLDGMADLRWILLNCNEFRYLR